MNRWNKLWPLVQLSETLARWCDIEVRLGDEAVHWRYEGDKDNERRPAASVTMRCGNWDIHLRWRETTSTRVVTESMVHFVGRDWDGTLPPEFVEFMDRHFRREVAG